MKSVFFGILLVSGIHIAAFAQVPQIDKVERITAYPFSTVQITGSGFSATPAQLQVWFGNVRGNILTSTESFISVEVPAQARLSNVEVVNLSSKRSGKSANMFVPNFSGVQPLGTFTSQSFASPAGAVFDLCTCDFNLDGKTDIAGSKFQDGSSNLMLMTNTGSPGTIGFSVSSIILNSNPTYSLACGDLNGDGKPEIVATRGGNSDGAKVYIFPNNSTIGGSISFGSAVVLDIILFDFGREVAIRDLNKDGRSEIIVTNSATNFIYIFENKLTSGTIVAGEFTRVDKSISGNMMPDGVTQAGSLALVVEDFSGDGWPEIAIMPSRSYAAQKIFILTNPADGTVNFSTISNFSILGSANINDFSSADFNADGRLDLVFADRASDKAFVWLNLGNLAFSSVNSTTGFPALDAWGTDVADMNGDGFADFVISGRDLTTHEVKVFINNGAGTSFTPGPTITTVNTNWFVKAGDYDGDSKPDLAVTTTNFSSTNAIDVWRNRTCHQPVILNDNPLTICNGQTITLKAVPIQGVTFNWSKGTNTGATSNITFADAGTITVTATGEGGTCTPNASITVNTGAGTAPGAPTITQPVSGVCAGTTLTLQTNSVAGGTYLWSGPNNYSASTGTPSSLVTSSAASTHKGDYYLRVKVGDCTSEQSAAKFVDVISPASFTITGVSPLCAGQPLALSVSPSSEYNFQWKLNNSNISLETESSFPKTPRNALANDDGSYTVLVSHNIVTSCASETAPFILNVYSAPVASFSTDPPKICVGSEVTFVATGFDDTAPVNFAWTFGDGGSKPNETIDTTKHIYNDALTGITASLTITYTGVTGCSSSSSTTPLDVTDATAPSIVASPDTIICGNGSESVTLTVPETFTSYTWSTTQTTQVISVTVHGVYTVETLDASGCIGNAQIELTERSGCESGGGPSLTVSKFFSPDNNGDNDYWKILEVADLSADCEANIFDGRGKRVVTLKQSDLVTGWRGTSGPSGGADLPEGTYYYVIGCPGSKPVTGSVLIAR